MRYVISIVITLIVLMLGRSSLAVSPSLSNRIPKEKDNSHVRTDPNLPGIRQGGDTIASATLIAAIPYVDSGTTAGYTDDYDEVCPYDGSTSPDVVYAFTPFEDVVVDIDLCGSLYDTKVYVYDTNLDLVACNDDFGDPDCGAYVSKLEHVELTASMQYYIVIDGYGGDFGDYVLEIAEHVPCVIGCPPGGEAENEPPLIVDYFDEWNGGCNTEGFPPFQYIREPEFCGVSGWYTYQGSDYRDTDWFTRFVPASGFLYLTIDAEYPVYLFELWPHDCASCEAQQVVTGGPCSPGIMTITGNPLSRVWVEVAPTTYSSPGWEPDVCEFDYVLTIDSVPGTITVDPEPDDVLFPWHLAGPGGYSYDGAGDTTLTATVMGDYSLEWGDVEGWVAPFPNPDVGLLMPGEDLTFSGTYTYCGTPDLVVFPEEIAMTANCLSHQDTIFTLTNTGEGTILGNISGAAVPYTFLYGDGSFALAGGATHEVGIRFAPLQVGTYLCDIGLGIGGGEVVTLTGTAVGPVCRVEPTQIVFPDPVPVGDTAVASFVITNEGGGNLSGNVTEVCEPFGLDSGAGPFALYEADTLTVDVRFTPVGAGSFECTVETGTYLCGDVTVTGTAYPCDSAPLLYVDVDATGSGDGASWTNALTDLQLALAAVDLCPAITEIWVAEGTYKPTQGAERDATFLLRNGLVLYGGFAGGETEAGQRDPAVNETILSGDIGVPGDETDNVYRVVTSGSVDETAVLDGFTITGGYALGDITSGGGIYINQPSGPTLARLVIRDNTGYVGGGVWCGGPVTFSDIVFEGNHGSNGGGLYNGGNVEMFNVVFRNNTGSMGAGMNNQYGTVTLCNTVFEGNVATGSGGGLRLTGGGPITLVNTTFSGNSANQGGALYNNGVVPVLLANSILWGNSAAEGAEIAGSGLINVTYSLIAGCGGSGPGWDLPGGYDSGFNLDADPLFVETLAGGLRLGTGSPAIDAGLSDLYTGPATAVAGQPRIQGDAIDMGAFEGGYEAGFFAYARIDSIVDVPADQGGWVRIWFGRSTFDHPDAPEPVVERYDIHRRIDDPQMIADIIDQGECIDTERVLRGADGGELKISPQPDATLWLFEGRVYFVSAPTAEATPPGDWEVLGNVSAQQEDQYVFLAPTLGDATATEEFHTHFYITAHTTNPTVFYASPVDSGYSIDNIAPGVPTGISAAYSASGVTLAWDEAPETDFQYYRIYRGEELGFEPAPENLVQETSSSEWTDSSPEPWSFLYKITALDHSGNEGEAGSPSSVTEVRDAELPARYTLIGAVPNPLNPQTTIAFELPKQEAVTLRVFDVAGRLVRVLVDGEVYDKGRHEAIWRGRDESGRQCASGTYFCRLEAGTFSETKRMVLLK